MIMQSKLATCKITAKRRKKKKKKKTRLTSPSIVQIIAPGNYPCTPITILRHLLRTSYKAALSLTASCSSIAPALPFSAVPFAFAFAAAADGDDEEEEEEDTLDLDLDAAKPLDAENGTSSPPPPFTSAQASGNTLPNSLFSYPSPPEIHY
jgi:hypothetical protein